MRAAQALLAAACLACAATPAAASNLLVNGGFENPTVGYQLVPGGNSSAISGWTTVLSGVEHYNSPAYGVGPAADGGSDSSAEAEGVVPEPDASPKSTSADGGDADERFDATVDESDSGDDSAPAMAIDSGTSDSGVPDPSTIAMGAMKWPPVGKTVAKVTWKCTTRSVFNFDQAPLCVWDDLKGKVCTTTEQEGECPVTLERSSGAPYVRSLQITVDEAGCNRKGSLTSCADAQQVPPQPDRVPGVCGPVSDPAATNCSPIGSAPQPSEQVDIADLLDGAYDDDAPTWRITTVRRNTTPLSFTHGAYCWSGVPGTYTRSQRLSPLTAQLPGLETTLEDEQTYAAVSCEMTIE